MSERERFEKYCETKLIDPDGHLGISVWAGWQAALSTRKPYGYGIVNSKGPASGLVLTETGADDHVRPYRNAGKADYRAVELFYEDKS